jgi:undecaprenyl-diphosphatase
MISVGEAVVLGALQGLTEFLPISSSGHLAVAHRFMTPLSAEDTLAVDVALHLGTLVAVVVYFWGDLWAMLRALGRPRTSGWRYRWIWLVGLATLPAVVLGLPLRGVIEESTVSMTRVGLELIFTGVLLYMASAVRGTTRDEGELDARDAVVMGFFQALALLPGVSRSGSTVAGGLFRRLRPDVAARFSFLMAIPAIAGAELVEVPKLADFGPQAHAPLLAGIVVAGATGFAAIWGLFRVMRAQRLHYFAYYTWALGALLVVGATFFGL